MSYNVFHWYGHHKSAYAVTGVQNNYIFWNLRNPIYLFIYNFYGATTTIKGRL